MLGSCLRPSSCLNSITWRSSLSMPMQLPWGGPGQRDVTAQSFCFLSTKGGLISQAPRRTWSGIVFGSQETGEMVLDDLIHPGNRSWGTDRKTRAVWCPAHARVASYKFPTAQTGRETLLQSFRSGNTQQTPSLHKRSGSQAEVRPGAVALD